MCGIIGQINTNKLLVDPKVIENMTRTIKHRGPDDNGIWCKANVGLGHVRLSIIDLSPRGHQPMSNEDESIWIVFNGEIYNFEDLRPALEKKGHTFRSNTDTEVIIHLYEEYKENCVTHLRGMFAFAIWDDREQKLFLARDRVGEKPLKYFFDGTRCIFASELKALLTHPEIPKKAHLPSLLSCLSLNHVPAPETGFENIQKLPAAHYAVLHNGTLKITKYWSLDFNKKTSIAYAEAQRETLKLLKESVRLRLIADVPVGAFLSGGLDSSAIVALMSELTPKVKTFSIGFPDEGFDERENARFIANHFKTEHTEFVVKPDAIHLLPKLVYQYEEPYSDSSALPSYYLAELTRKSVTVALTGDGGDEAFGGYKRYLYWNLLHRCKKNIYETIETYFYFDLKKYKKIFTKDFIENQKLTRVPLKNLDDIFKLSFETFLPDDLLPKVDIATMAHSLETRPPFLDHVLLEFAASLPSHWKVKNFQTKKILKDALQSLLPRETLQKKKQGFELPVDRWFQGPLYTFANEILLDQKTVNRKYMNPRTLEQLLKDHKNGKKKHGQRIWTLICLELWHRTFIDNPPTNL